MKTKMLLLVTLLIVLVGVASASEVSNDTVDISYTDTVAQNTTTDVQESVMVKSKENKEPLKEDKLENVDNYSSLNNRLTSSPSNYDQLIAAVEEAKRSSVDEYYIELSPGDYRASTPMVWGDATGTTRKLIINGNGNTINGTTSPEFITVNEGYTWNYIILH